MTSKLASHRSLLAALLPVVLAATGPSQAHAQPAPTAPQDPYDSDDDGDDQDDVAPMQRDDPSVQPEAAPVVPTTPAPTARPPAPPARPPPPQGQAMQPQPQQPAASGQWVFTQQRGWLWMPYGEQYVYAPPTAAGVEVYPYEYVYAPAYGWTWVTAPWVWGWGPRVYFSIGGPVRFSWFHSHPFIGGHRFFGGHGVIRSPGFRGGFRGHVGGSHFSSRGHFGGRHR